MKVKTAMHRGVQWFAPNTPILDIARAMKAGDIGAVPIGEDDRLVGMVTDRDITCKAVAAGTDLSKVTARDVMSQGIVFCRENESVADAAQLMESRKIRRLPVINKNKRMVGMLSIGDISNAAPPKLSGEVIKAVSAHH